MKAIQKGRLSSFIFLAFYGIFLHCHSADYRTMNDRSGRLYIEAEKLISAGKSPEAAKILSILKDLYPQDEKVHKLIESLDPASKKLLLPTFLGFNTRAKYKTKSSFWKKLLYYFPNRFLDLFDILSMRFNYGPQLGASVWGRHCNCHYLNDLLHKL